MRSVKISDTVVSVLGLDSREVRTSFDVRCEHGWLSGEKSAIRRVQDEAAERIKPGWDVTPGERRALRRFEQAVDVALGSREEDRLIEQALHFTDAPEAPDIPVPVGGEVTSGWLANEHSLEVTRSWSEVASHGSGSAPKQHPHRMASQNGVALHSTKERALRAMRRKVERRCAAMLRGIDIQIQNACKEQS